MASKSKLSKFIEWRIRVSISETRSFIGTFLAFDRHMNVVLADTEEHRKVRNKKTGQEQEVKKKIGLMIIRGENIISISVDSPPLPKPKVPTFQVPKGTAQAVPGPRVALPSALGLAGPVPIMPPGHGMIPPPPPPPPQ